MSTELKPMEKTGCRNVELSVTRFWGGKNGMCLQLTGIMEEGGHGYVQLNKRDMLTLIKTWRKNIGALGTRKLARHRPTAKVIKPSKRSKRA